MSDVNETRHCFRCKGMAVIDPVVLGKLPGLLFQVAGMLGWAMHSAEGIGDYDEWRDVIERLREYAILTENLPDD